MIFKILNNNFVLLRDVRQRIDCRGGTGLEKVVGLNLACHFCGWLGLLNMMSTPWCNAQWNTAHLYFSWFAERRVTFGRCAIRVDITAFCKKVVGLLPHQPHPLCRPWIVLCPSRVELPRHVNSVGSEGRLYGMYGNLCSSICDGYCIIVSTLTVSL